MRIPSKPKNLGALTREGIAKKHARYMQMFGENDWKTIDRKIQEFGNDYYRSDLFVDRPTMAQAVDDFETFRTGTPAMDAVAADMRQFYELVPAAPAIKKEVVKATAPKTEVKAQEFKDKKVKEIIKENPELVQVETTQLVEDSYQQALKDIEFQNQVDNIGNDPANKLLDNALLVAGGIGLGSIVGSSVGNKPTISEEELLQLKILQEAGVI